MRYRSLAPAPPLAPYVECYWFLDAAAGASSAVERVLPDGCIEIIAHAGDRFARILPGGARETQPAVFLYGQLTRGLALAPGARVSTMGIRFRPAGAAAFVPESLAGATDRTIELADLLSHDGARFGERLLEATSHRRRAEIADRFLLGRLGSGSTPDARVHGAVAEILRRRGQVRVRQLADDVGLGPRQLERAFGRRVGLAPKAFARVIRLQGLIETLRREPARPWAVRALDAGFFDQPHLIADVRNLADCAPTALTPEDGTLLAYLTSTERLARYLGAPAA